VADPHGGFLDGFDFAFQFGKFLIGESDFFSELLRFFRYWRYELLMLSSDLT